MVSNRSGSNGDYLDFASDLRDPTKPGCRN